LLGPIFVGAVAAIVAVLLLAVDAPDKPSTIDREGIVKVLEESGAGSAAISAVRTALEEPRDAFASWYRLVPIALIAGFAGVAVLRIARSRMLAAIGAVAFSARAAGIQEGGQAAAKAIQEHLGEASAEKRRVKAGAGSSSKEDEPVEHVRDQMTDLINAATEQRLVALERLGAFRTPVV
jgi:hypothetical protein